MAHYGKYRQWPFLTQEEFDEASAHFDRRYIKAKLGPTRKIFKLTSRRSLTGATWIEIVRLLQLPEEEDDLIKQLEKLEAVTSLGQQNDIDMALAEEEDGVSVAFSNV